jgi:Carboxypeptidase regulatory-like domain
MWYRFSVIEPFTGLRPDEKELVIYLSLGGGSPQIGQKFFVHAKRAGNQIRLAECGATRPVEEASSDIHYLRERQAGSFRPFIAGSVLRHYSGSPYAVEAGLDGPPRGLAGATVEIQGETRRRLQTDDEGKFRVDDVKPGRYTIRVDFRGYMPKGTQLVDVSANGCGIAHVGMFTNASISGVVRRADGTPAIGVELDLVDKDARYRSMTETLGMIKTGSRGEFFMGNLPSGEYLLGHQHQGKHAVSRSDPTDILSRRT